MGGGGLLIFYVTNETNETNVRPSKSPLKGDFFILPHFAAKTPNFAVFCGSLFRSKAVPLHRISKRAEIANKHVNC